MALDVAFVKLIDETSEKLGIDRDIVSLAVTAQFKFAKLIIEENQENLRDSEIIFNYLGKFKVKPGRRKHLNEARRRHFEVALKDMKDGD